MEIIDTNVEEKEGLQKELVRLAKKSKLKRKFIAIAECLMIDTLDQINSLLKESVEHGYLAEDKQRKMLKLRLPN